MPSIFTTFSPDDTDGVLNVRLAFPSTDYYIFPANDGGLTEAIRDHNQTSHNIIISPSAVKGFLATNPVAAAEVFRLFTNAIFNVQLGTPPGHQIHRT